MRWYHWAALSLLGVGLVFVWVLTGGKGPDPKEQLDLEIDAINAKAEVDRIKAEMGAAQALQHVEDKYRDDLASLEGEAKNRAEKLKDSPEQLAAFIVRGRVKS